MTYTLAPRISQHEITENEMAWIGFLRTLSHGDDPAPSLTAVQALRAVLEGRRADES